MEFIELPDISDVSGEKMDLLLALIDVLATSYPEANFYEWARQLVQYEGFGNIALGNHLGLFLQFQRPEPIITLQGTQADWWLFLCPEGADYGTFDNKPVHVLFGFVMPKQNPHLESSQMIRFLSLEIFKEERENYAQFWKGISRLSPSCVARQLNDMIDSVAN